jgi:threonine/homoserine/homoserine lactone efflux protein
MGWLMTLLRYLGAAYLIFLGLLLLKAPKQKLGEEKHSDILAVQHFGKQFIVGFFSAILNPKNAIFYLSLFTVMVSPDTGLATRYLYAVWMTGMVFLWDATMVMTIGNGRIRNSLGQSIFWVEKVSGLMLTIFGMYLPFS